MQEEEQRAAHYQKMTQTPVPRLVLSLAAPTIVTMLVTSIYNMADTFFVSQLGTSAAGAVGIVFSLMALIQAVGFTLGMGGGNLVARQLGARRDEEATKTASTAFFTALVCGAVMAVAGTALRAPLMRFLGATETILPYAEAYVTYILFAAPIMCASFVMNNLLRGEGKALLGMVGIGVGGLLNMGLDPLFIFTFGLGTAGAAMATALSQLVSFCILLSFFVRGKSGVHLRLRSVSREPAVYGSIVKTGLPSFCRQGVASLATIALNKSAAFYGDAAVAAMSIVARIFMFMFSVMLGLGQGFQPVAGFNYGAKRYDRVRSASRFTARLGTLLMAAVAAAFFVFAPQCMAAFRRDDAQVIALGTIAFRAQCMALPLFGISTVTNMSLQCTGQAWRATFLALCRQGIFFLPIIALLPLVLGVNGVLVAQPLADLCTFAVSVPFYVRYMRRLRQSEDEAARGGTPSR